MDVLTVNSFSKTQVFTTHARTHTEYVHTHTVRKLAFNVAPAIYRWKHSKQSRTFLNMKVRAKHFAYYEQRSQHNKKVLKAILCFSADGGLILEDVPLVESLLLYLCDVFLVLINSPVCWFILEANAWVEYLPTSSCTSRGDGIQDLLLMAFTTVFQTPHMQHTKTDLWTNPLLPIAHSQM